MVSAQELHIDDSFYQKQFVFYMILGYEQLRKWLSLIL